MFTGCWMPWTPTELAQSALGCISTTPTVKPSPTPWLRWHTESPSSTPRPVVWAGVPMRRARPATWRRRTSSGRSTGWGSRQGSTSRRWWTPVSGWPGTLVGRRRRGLSRRWQVAMTDPTRFGPERFDPERFGPERFDPEHFDRAPVEMLRVEPLRVEPLRVEPLWAEPRRVSHRHL